MPRTGQGRGGVRTGTPGKSYGNRTDLAGPVPDQAAPGQQYGTAGAQIESQRQVPVAAPPVATGPAGGEGTPSPGPQAQGGAAAIPAGPAPGSLPWLHPTQRPNEPITAGLPSGPGPGPEALTGVGAAGVGHSNVAALLGALASVPGATSDVVALANYALSGKA